VSRRRAREPSPTGLSSSSLLEAWLQAVLAAPGLTSLTDIEAARAMLLEDSLRGAPVVARFEGPIVDVGSGGGAPGIPIAASLPEREVTLLESERRKAEFLEGWTAELPNLSVVWGRAEEQPGDHFGVALAKALAPPVVAAEWCLPLVRPGGVVVLWVGPNADLDAIGHVAEQLNAAPPETDHGLVVIRKLGPTPEGFPRRPGMARKRPLA
jgi:16S rRNA (guanine527-N7)-methyltransferase